MDEITITELGALSLRPDPANPPFLTLVSSSHASSMGKVFRLYDGESLLGRAPGAQCRIWDSGVSRQHAKIARQPNGDYVLIDLGSTNGTYLNGLRIKSAPLHDGDRIQIGTVTTLKFTLGGQTDDRGERLRQALVASGVGTWEWERSTKRFVFTNGNPLGPELPKDPPPGTQADFWEHVSRADRRRVRRAITRSVKNGEPYNLELKLEAGGGKVRWVSMRGEVFRDDAGSPSHVAGTLVDVTSRKAMEQELRRQALLFESLNEGVVVFDLTGRILDWNSSARAMFGYDKAEVVGTAVGAALDRAGPDALTPGILNGIAEGGRWSGECTLHRKNGSECLVEVAAVPLRGYEGSHIANVAILRDVGERREMQERLLLADRLASLGTLAAGMAHEINNPLTYVMANVASLADKLSSLNVNTGELVELREELEEVRTGAARIRDIVHDLNVFSRGSKPGEETLVDVNMAIDFALKVADNEIRHHARVIKTLEPVAPVLGAESRLGQVFLNLLVNAAHAIPEGAAALNEVRISSRFDPEAGRVWVEVTDTGQGIAPEDLARIFEPFVTTKPAGRGMGLGLYICHNTVRSMGGDLSVESQVGKGSTFRVSLPAAQGPSSPVAGGHELRQKSVRRHILVVDDELLVVSAIRRFLTRHHDVTISQSARDALERLKNGERFDVVLCDLMMPDVTGMDFQAQLKAEFPEQAKRIIFMTGGAFTPKAQRFLEEERSRSIGKPIDFELLEALMREMMSGSA
jgi:PAS domain S-box-containing protein